MDLFDRSVATLFRSWAYLAAGSPGAEVVETDSSATAIFSHSPDREFLNNAVLARGLTELGGVLEEIKGAYRDRGIERYAIWVHESEATIVAGIKARGYEYDSSTRTMAMPIGDLAEVDTSWLDLTEPSLEEFWRLAGVNGLVPDLDPAGGHFYGARLNGEAVATLMAFDHDSDCGIYMVGTAPAARRQGLATALSVHALREARARGCTTASLQSTAMAERVYASVGFRDLGRFDEYVPVKPSLRVSRR